VPVSSLPFPIYSAPLPPASEVGEAGAIPPPYSCDPSGSDLPRGNEDVLFFLLLLYFGTLLTCVLYETEPNTCSDKKWLPAAHRQIKIFWMLTVKIPSSE